MNEQLTELTPGREEHSHLLPCVGIILSVLSALLVTMMFTGIWPWSFNGYNSYTLQACAWLEGRLDLGYNYDWLELAIFEGKYFVSFPPFPSYVMLPFAAVFGTNTPDGWIQLAFTVVGIIAAMGICRKVNGSDVHMAFWVPFLFLGTGYLFIALKPAVWFFAQSVCFTMCLLALWAALCGRGG